MTRRRNLLLALAGLPALALARPPRPARPLPPECRWILGTWQSDVEQTMANFSFQGQRPPPEARARMAARFGKLSHTFTPTRFTVDETFDGQTQRREWNFRVARFSAESVTLAFPKSDMPEITLFRKDDGYFLRTGDNFEYFRKAPA